MTVLSDPGSLAVACKQVEGILWGHNPESQSQTAAPSLMSLSPSLVTLQKPGRGRAWVSGAGARCD
jgi:hypothetical protein